MPLKFLNHVLNEILIVQQQNLKIIELLGILQQYLLIFYSIIVY